MNPLAILHKYYSHSMMTYSILAIHSQQVAEYSVLVAQHHPELNANATFLYEAAMLHDIAIFKTYAPDIGCHGELPYICHGYLGRELLEQEGWMQHALVCERHTGAGLTLRDIQNQQLPLPQREMVPVSVEEQIVCYADKFFSKSGDLTHRKKIDKVRKNLLHHGMEQLQRFDLWHEKFRIV